MDIRQIRRTKTLELIKQKGISKAEFSRLLGKSPQQINELLRDKNPRNIGHNIARLIESTFNKEDGWLDKEDDRPDKEDNSTSSSFSEGSITEIYQKASHLVVEARKAQRTWMEYRTFAFRAIEDHFREWLAGDGIDLLPPVGRFDYCISSETDGQLSVNLFIPLPSLSSWKIPGFEDEQPDFLAIALMPKYDTSKPSYFVLSKPEYLSLSEKSGTQFLSFDLEGTFSLANSVYIRMSRRSGDSMAFVDYEASQLVKLWHKPEMSELKAAPDEPPAEIS